MRGELVKIFKVQGLDKKLNVWYNSHSSRGETALRHGAGSPKGEVPLRHRHFCIRLGLPLERLLKPDLTNRRKCGIMRIRVGQPEVILWNGNGHLSPREPTHSNTV